MRKLRKYHIGIILGALFSIVAGAQTVQQANTLTAASLREDFRVMKGVLLSYHPGLYRYQDSTTVARYFDELELQLKRNMTLAEAYLLFSRFTARIQCGHTFCNYYNQSGTVKDSLFNRMDKVPFTFFLFGKRMFIDKNVSGNAALSGGTEIVRINDIPVDIILDTLVWYIKGDGSNNLKRFNDLNLSGLGKFEAFDVFFPLLFPPVGNAYVLKVEQPDQPGIQDIQINTVSRADRFTLIEEKYGKQPSTYDDLWRFEILNSGIGYLKIGTFVTDKLAINWRKYLDNVFEELNDKHIQNLVIDIRGNEGGDDEVNLVLAKKMAKRQIEFPAFRELLRYERVSAEFRPYLNTWDKNFYDRSGQVVKVENGFYTWKKDRGTSVIRQNSKAFPGNSYLLVDAANSSATFFLTAGLQQNKIATVIGSETGGNRKGTNGGQLFFLRLPNSNIEIDVPLIGYYPLTEQPDKGLQPDMEVPLTLSDRLSKKDRVLEQTLALIKASARQ